MVIVKSQSLNFCSLCRAIDSYMTTIAKSTFEDGDENTKRTTSNITRLEQPIGTQTSSALASPTQDGTESLGASPVSKREAKRERVAMYNRVLSEREKATQEHMEELRTSIYLETMKECTFKPTITAVAARHGGVPFAIETLQKMALNEDIRDRRRTDSEPSELESGFNIALTPNGVTVFDRLYSQKDKVPKSIAQEKHRPIEARELDGCTFVPQLYKPTAQLTANTTNKVSNPPRSPTGAHSYPKGQSRRISVTQMIDAVLKSTDDVDEDEEEGTAQVIAPFSSVPRKKPLTDSLGDALFGDSGGDMSKPVSLQPQPKGYSTSIQR